MVEGLVLRDDHDEVLERGLGPEGSGRRERLLLSLGARRERTGRGNRPDRDGGEEAGGGAPWARGGVHSAA
jgi:hypothetical protein